MTNRIKTTLIVMLFSGTVTEVRAQKLATEHLTEISKSRAFFDEEIMHLEFDYKVYTQLDNRLIDTKTGVLDKTGEEYYYAIGTISIIQNSKWLVYLDTEDQIMAVREKEVRKTENLIGFDLAMTAFTSITKTENEDTYIYSMIPKGSIQNMYTKIDYHLKKSNLEPAKLVFHYAEGIYTDNETGSEQIEKVRMEISYYNAKAKHNRSFDTKQFFSVDGKSLKTTQEYQDYEIVDQRLAL